MKAFCIIVGILMALFGIVCIFTPLKTVFDINVMIAILAAVYGVVGIFCFLHPVLFGILFAWTLGVLIGVFFVQTGFSVMFLSTKAKQAE